MDGLRRTLPALGHLDVFEAAARAGNFTRAGRALGITQAAVSYSVRALETDLGVALFDRRGREVVLTPPGRVLYREVSTGFGNIRRAIAGIRETAGRSGVALSVSSAFATFWLLPRLPAFRVQCPDIDLQVRAVDRDTDVSAEGVALGVRYGPGILPSYARARIAREVIRPVCSPAFARAHITDATTLSPQALARLRLVHLDELHRPCPTWRDWFTSNGVTWRGGGGTLRFTEYALAIQAALDGEGVVLGWRHLVDPLIARGALVQLGATDWCTEVEYSVVWASELPPKAARVRDWMLAEARAAEEGALGWRTGWPAS
jgi:DNA-binding transcriptional LysR family regulator